LRHTYIMRLDWSLHIQQIADFGAEPD